MIHEEICTYEVAKLAKEKGSPIECDLFYNRNGELCDDRNYDSFDNKIWCYAPTQSLLQRWLREKKGVTICVDIYDDGWFFDISTFYQQDTGVYEVDIPYKSSNVTPVYPTYELALEDALAYSLKNLV